MVVVKLRKRIKPNIKLCLTAEKLIKNTVQSYKALNKSFKINDEINWDNIQKIERMLFIETYDKIFEGKYEHQSYDNELINLSQEEMINHFYLSLITDRTLSHSEFNMKFESHHLMYEWMRDKVWWHNIHCEAFFINTYREILKGIDIITGHERDPSMILYIVRWIFRMVKIIEEFRHNFQYCSSCEYNTNNECKHWKKIIFEINNLPNKINFKSLASRIIEYFKQLKLSCKISNGIEQLKTIKEDLRFDCD